MTKRIWVPFLIAGCLASPLAAAINEVRVVAVQPGTEWRENPTAEWKEVERNQVLQQGHELSTDPEGQVTLAFADNSTVVVRFGTQIKIASFFTEGGVVRTELLLKNGELAAKVNKSETTKSDFRIKSPTGTASVRGTELQAVRYDAVRGLEVRLVEGFANIGTTLGTAQVTQGETGKVNNQGAVQTPQEVKNSTLASNAYAPGATKEEVAQIQRNITADTGVTASSASEVGDIADVAVVSVAKAQAVETFVNFNTGAFPTGAQASSAFIASGVGTQSADGSPFLLLTSGGSGGNIGFFAQSTNLPAPATLEITFEHNFITTENPAEFFAADDAFVALVQSNGQVLTLARQSVLSTPLTSFNPALLPRPLFDGPGGNPPDFAAQSGFQRTTNIISAPAGRLDLIFSVVDAEDNIVESGVQIDNINIIATIGGQSGGSTSSGLTRISGSTTPFNGQMQVGASGLVGGQ